MSGEGVLALIPARGGSKRIPGKNVRVLGDKALIAWTIECAQRSRAFDSIVVSTDDPGIAEIATRHGVAPSGLRPAELSTDGASSVDVVAFEIEQARRRGQDVRAVALLQPTSPFRRESTIHDALALFDGARSVVSVSPLTQHWDWCREVLPDGTLVAPDKLPESLFRLNGLIYVAHADTVLTKRSLYSEHSVALVVHDIEEAVDIDTELDWAFAEAIVSFRRKMGRR